MKAKRTEDIYSQVTHAYSAWTRSFWNHRHEWVTLFCKDKREAMEEPSTTDLTLRDAGIEKAQNLCESENFAPVCLRSYMQKKQVKYEASCPIHYDSPVITKATSGLLAFLGDRIRETGVEVIQFTQEEIWANICRHETFMSANDLQRERSQIPFRNCSLKATNTRIIIRGSCFIEIMLSTCHYPESPDVERQIPEPVHTKPPFSRSDMVMLALHKVFKLTSNSKEIRTKKFRGILRHTRRKVED